MPFCTFIPGEHCGTHHTVRPGRKDYWPLVAREELPAALGTTGANHPDGSCRHVQPHDRFSTGYLSAYRPTVAAALLVHAMRWLGKGCPPPWPHSKDLFAEDQGYCRSYSSHDTFQCDTLEHTIHGRSPRCERSNDTSDLEAAQSQAPSDQILQAQSRQAFLREARRRCWSLPQSAGQVISALCRREKPNSSTRSHPTGPSVKERPLRNHDPRLQTQWHHDTLCGLEYARWESDRRLHATSSAPGVHSLSQDHRCRNAGHIRSSFDCGQLRDTQTSPSNLLASAAPSVPSTLYSNFKFMAESCGTMVSRSHRQTHSPGKLSKRTGIDRHHRTLCAQSQSKPTRLRLDCFG